MGRYLNWSSSSSFPRTNQSCLLSHSSQHTNSINQPTDSTDQRKTSSNRTSSSLEQSVPLKRRQAYKWIQTSPNRAPQLPKFSDRIHWAAARHWMAARLPNWTLKGSSAVEQNRHLDALLVRTSISPPFMPLMSSKISISVSSLQLSPSTAIRHCRDIVNKHLSLLQEWAPAPKSNKPCYSKHSNKKPSSVTLTKVKSGCTIQEIKCMHHLYQTRHLWLLINAEVNKKENKAIRVSGKSY